MISRQDLALLAAFIQVVSAQQSSSGGSSGESSKAGDSHGSSGGASSEEGESSGPSDTSLANDLLIALGAFVVVVFIYRVVLYSVQYVRHLTSLNNTTQRYFAVPNTTWASVKNNILYAPLFRQRHNAEFRLSSAIHMGVLPTRFQTLFMIAIIATNVTLCVYNVPWSGPEAAANSELLKRSGTLATVNLIPVIIMAGRNNALIPLLNVSFDSFNMMHRLFARILTLEAITHGVCWFISKVQKSGWGAVSKDLSEGPTGMIVSGFVATVLFIAVVTLAYSPIRHAFYETFLHLHIAMIIVAFAFIWIHLNGYAEQQFYLLVAIIAWVTERIIRALTLTYRNLGSGGTKAQVEALPGDAMRITFKLARPWTFKPGQHFFLTIPSVGLWTSHPFSVAWFEKISPLTTSPSFSSSATDEKGLVMTRQDLSGSGPFGTTTFSAIIRRRTGFTDSLWKKAEAAGAFNGSTLSLNAFVNGPYGLCPSLTSYGTVMLFATGVGITHQVPYVRELVNGFANGTVATRKVVLIWIIQSPEHLEWIRPWMTEILAMERRREVLAIKLFITRPRSAKEVHSPSSTVQMFPGRPGIDTLIGKECESQVGAMAVSVCGTGSLQDEVRRVCRDRGRWSSIDFVEESFSW